MTQVPPSTTWPEDFCGTVRLFPLPNVVLFPNVVLPLHIFEPRYCEMLSDALAADRLIAMSLLGPGWESQYDQRPPISPIVCIGKVVSHTHCEKDRHNILLVGLKRARIVHELETNKPFRSACVEIIEDQYSLDESLHRPQLVERLQTMFHRVAPDGLAAQQCFGEFVENQIPLGILTDIVTNAINLPIPIKLQLLAESNVDIRCRILTRCLEQKIKGECDESESSDCHHPISQGFPPRFSDN